MYIPDSLQCLPQPELAQVLLLADMYQAPVVADNAARVLAAMAGDSSIDTHRAEGSQPEEAMSLQAEYVRKSWGLDASVVRELVQVSLGHAVDPCVIAMQPSTGCYASCQSRAAIRLASFRSWKAGGHRSTVHAMIALQPGLQRAMHWEYSRRYLPYSHCQPRQPLPLGQCQCYHIDICRCRAFILLAWTGLPQKNAFAVFAFAVCDIIPVL